MYQIEIPRASRIISGISLAQILRHLPSPARAVWGADIVDGFVLVNTPTVKSVATTVGVPAVHVSAARLLSPGAREEVKCGERPLVLPRPAKRAPAPSVVPAAPTESPVIMSPQERLAHIVSEIGLDRTLNLLSAIECVPVAA